MVELVITQKFTISAEEQELIVVFEPSGIQVKIAAGDYITVAFALGGVGEMICRPGGELMLASSTLSKGPLLAWASDGSEIHTFS